MKPLAIFIYTKSSEGFPLGFNSILEEIEQNGWIRYKGRVFILKVLMGTRLCQNRKYSLTMTNKCPIFNQPLGPNLLGEG